MGQHGPVATGKYGGKPVRLGAEHRMPYRVDAPMEHVKPAGPKPLANAGPPKPERKQLTARDDAVLTPRKSRQPRIEEGWGAFWVHLNP